MKPPSYIHCFAADVRRWHARPSKFIIVPHEGDEPLEESRFRIEYPLTYAYLQSYQSFLGARRRYDLKQRYGPFYELFKTGDYLFAPFKVVWREIAADLIAAVATTVPLHGQPKPVVPDHKLIVVPFEREDEAYYLCGLLNSCLARALAKTFVIQTQFAPRLLKQLAFPTYDERDAIHRDLATTSSKAHQLAAGGREAAEELRQVETEIDRQAARLWGITDEELEEIQRALAELG